MQNFSSTNMSRKCKFITEYLVPSLNSQRFGSYLKWMDKKNSIFQLIWNHKSNSKWSEEEVQVFVEWDKIKGHYQPNEKDYFSRSKQRFRSLLNKLTVNGQIKKVESDMNSKKVYCITGVQNPRRKRKSSNADSGIFSTDDMSSDNIEMLTEDDEMNEFFYVDCNNNNLDDHNYSKLSIDSSANTNTGIEDVALSTFTNMCFNTGMKVLVEQNYLHCYNDLNEFESKGKNTQTNFSQGIIDEDLQVGSENAELIKYDDFVQGLNYCNTINENAALMKSTITPNIFNKHIENFLFEVEIEDNSDVKNLCNRILSWT